MTRTERPHSLARMLARMFVPAILLVACGGVKGDSGTTTPAPATDSDVEAVVAAIQADRLAATTMMTAMMASTLVTVIDADSFTSLANAASESCAARKSHLAARSQGRNDLWPRAYDDLHSAVGTACSIGTMAGDMSIRSKWAGAGLVQMDDLDKAVKALPDYSQAQLKRAISERR